MSDRLSLIGRELNDGGQRWNRRVLYDDALWVRQDDADRALAEVTSLAAQQHAGAVEALQHIAESSEHPSLTVRTTNYLGHVARKWLDENGYSATTGEQ